MREALEAWARSFGPTAMLGSIAALLVLGKFVHHAFQRRGLVLGLLVVPPPLISGMIGLIICFIIDRVDPLLADDFRSGVESIRRNLVGFVFAAFALGLMCSKANSLHKASLKGMAVSILHEGMPMMIYSQILLWGQSTCCLLIYLLLYGDRDALYPTMITLGAEAGMDVASAGGYTGDWLTTAEEAESMASVAVTVIGIVLITLKPVLLARGSLGAQYSREAKYHAVGALKDGKAEAFDRRPAALHRSFSHDAVPQMTEAQEEDANADPTASLGSHLSLIAIAVFCSFAFSMFLRVVEAQFEIQFQLLSGLRMFKVSMCVSLGLMLGLQRIRLRFRRDWFMRLCGLMLDLLIVSALCKSYPRRQVLNQQTHYLLCSLFVTLCVAWNLLAFAVIAPKIFPNFWYERALTLTGDALGRAPMGLLFARTLDPSMESPVPMAYAAKLLLFFVPTSGAKATIVAQTTRSYGPVFSLLLCALVLSTWAALFHTQFRERFVHSDKKKVVEAVSLEEEALLMVAPQGGAVQRGAGLRSRPSGGALAGLALLDDDAQSDLSSLSCELKLSVQSSILSTEQLQSLVHLLPEPKRSKGWQLGYCLRTHGACMGSLLSLCGARGAGAAALPCVVVIEDSWGYVFGGYVSPGLLDQKHYYGNGESFVFTVVPTLVAYPWTGKNSMFVVSHDGCLAMGGGGDGYAWQIDDELDTGVSCRSDTFDNPTLSSNEFFKCLNVEVWLLDHVSGYAV